MTTLLNSGSAMFSGFGRSTERNAQAIAAAVQVQCGVAAPAIVEPSAEVATISLLRAA